MQLLQKRKFNLSCFFLLIIFFLNFKNNITQIKGNNENKKNPNTSRIQKIKKYLFDSDNNKKLDKIQDKYKDNIFHFKPISKEKENKIEVVYIYDLNENLAQKKYIIKNEFYNYFYDEKNRLIYKTYLHDFQLFDAYENNNKNQIICVRDHKSQIKKKYKYNKKGQKKEKITIENHRTPYEINNIYKYKYNDKNQKIEKIHYETVYYETKNIFFKFFKINKKKSEKINQVINTYKYNEQEQKIKKIKKINNKEDVFLYKYCDYNKFF